MPIMTLAFMLAYLLLFAEGKEGRCTCADCRDTGKCCPKRHIGGISGLGDIRNRLELVMELGNDRLSFVNGYGDICGKLILLVGFVGHLGDHIIADAQPLDVDLTLLIGHKVLAESIAGDIRALHTEGKALQHAVIRSLFNADASGLCLVGKALSGLIFHDDGFTIFLNGETVGLLIKEEALGASVSFSV